MKERRGLRAREAILLIAVFLSPSIIMGFRMPLGPTLRWWIAAVVNGLVATVLTCVVEDALERRGRYVDSGVSWEEIRSWLKGPSLSYIATMCNCFFAILAGFTIWFLSDDVKELGLLVVIWVALTALNVVFGRCCLRTRER